MTPTEAERKLFAELEKRWPLDRPRYREEGFVRDSITGPELRVLRCARMGLSLDETAELLGVSIHTIRNQRAAAIRKLNARNLVQATWTAAEQGLLEPLGFAS